MLLLEHEQCVKQRFNRSLARLAQLVHHLLCCSRPLSQVDDLVSQQLDVLNHVVHISSHSLLSFLKLSFPVLKRLVVMNQLCQLPSNLIGLFLAL